MITFGMVIPHARWSIIRPFSIQRATATVPSISNSFKLSLRRKARATSADVKIWWWPNWSIPRLAKRWRISRFYTVVILLACILKSGAIDSGTAVRTVLQGWVVTDHSVSCVVAYQNHDGVCVTNLAGASPCFNEKSNIVSHSHQVLLFYNDGSSFNTLLSLMRHFTACGRHLMQDDCSPLLYHIELVQLLGETTAMSVRDEPALLGRLESIFSHDSTWLA